METNHQVLSQSQSIEPLVLKANSSIDGSNPEILNTDGGVQFLDGYYIDSLNGGRLQLMSSPGPFKDVEALKKQFKHDQYGDNKIEFHKSTITSSEQFSNDIQASLDTSFDGFGFKVQADILVKMNYQYSSDQVWFIASSKLSSGTMRPSTIPQLSKEALEILKTPNTGEADFASRFGNFYVAEGKAGAQLDIIFKSTKSITKDGTDIDANIKGSWTGSADVSIDAKFLQKLSESRDYSQTNIDVVAIGLDDLLQKEVNISKIDDAIALISNFPKMTKPNSIRKYVLKPFSSLPSYQNALSKHDQNHSSRSQVSKEIQSTLNTAYLQVRCIEAALSNVPSKKREYLEDRNLREEITRCKLDIVKTCEKLFKIDASEATKSKTQENQSEELDQSPYDGIIETTLTQISRKIKEIVASYNSFPEQQLFQEITVLLAEIRHKGLDRDTLRPLYELLKQLYETQDSQDYYDMQLHKLRFDCQSHDFMANIMIFCTRIIPEFEPKYWLALFPDILQNFLHDIFDGKEFIIQNDFNKTYLYHKNDVKELLTDQQHKTNWKLQFDKDIKHPKFRLQTYQDTIYMVPKDDIPTYDYQRCWGYASDNSEPKMQKNSYWCFRFDKYCRISICKHEIEGDSGKFMLASNGLDSYAFAGDVEYFKGEPKYRATTVWSFIAIQSR